MDREVENDRGKGVGGKMREEGEEALITAGKFSAGAHGRDYEHQMKLVACSIFD